MSAFTQLAKWDQETKIQHMDLEQIKPMLCPKSNYDPLECVGCKSVAGCPAGQRANVLLEEITKRKLIAQGANPRYADRSAKAREICRAATRAEDPYKFVMDHYGSSRKAARERFRVWEKTYPDIMEGFNWRVKAPCKGRKKVETEEKPVMENEDEISIEEFLKETAGNVAEAAQEPASVVLVEQVSADSERQAEPGKKADSEGIEQQLARKYEQIEAEKKKVSEQIKTLEERLAWLNSQQEALVTVKNLFDPNTAIARSLITG